MIILLSTWCVPSTPSHPETPGLLIPLLGTISQVFPELWHPIASFSYSQALNGGPWNSKLGTLWDRATSSLFVKALSIFILPFYVIQGHFIIMDLSVGFPWFLLLFLFCDLSGPFQHTLTTIPS